MSARPGPSGGYHTTVVSLPGSCVVERRWSTEGESPARELVRSTR
jgi:hypothetical protein